MDQIPMDWILAGEPWIAYRARLDLLGETEQDPQVAVARQGLLADVRVRQLLMELQNWHGNIVASHKSASQPFHQLSFLADLGLTIHDPGVAQIMDSILAHQSEEGPFQLRTKISAGHGGSGTDQWAWALCDAPLVLYSLAKLGLQHEPGVRKAFSCLQGLARENGFPCAVSKELTFRGPGRKEDPCPFANLAMLKAMSAFGAGEENPACRFAAECLLELWAESETRHPYIFYMGTDFRKLKVPFVWYDLMHVLEVLTQFPWLREDLRLKEMTALLASKMDAEGKFTAESIWTAWKEWELGQKKVPSRWLTLCAWRILRRMGDTPPLHS